MIIKTPQPDREERLVVVPPESCTPVFDDGKPAGLSVRAQGARDATPDDLGRAGYVLEAAGAEHIREIIVATERPLLARAERAERERERAVEWVERADQRETTARNALTAAGIPDVEPYPAEAVDAREASLRTGGRSLHTPERIARLAAERDEARRLHSAAEAQVACRNELRARLAQAERELDEARAELARLTAVGEGEPTDEELDALLRVDSSSDMTNIVRARIVWRAGVARERARQARTEPRATDEELLAIADAVYEEAHGGEILNGPHEIARRVDAMGAQ